MHFCCSCSSKLIVDRANHKRITPIFCALSLYQYFSNITASEHKQLDCVRRCVCQGRKVRFINIVWTVDCFVVVGPLGAYYFEHTEKNIRIVLVQFLYERMCVYAVWFDLNLFNCIRLPSVTKKKRIRTAFWH